MSYECVIWGCTSSFCSQEEERRRDRIHRVRASLSSPVHCSAVEELPTRVQRLARTR
jgi:hypothetical protein